MNVPFLNTTALPNKNKMHTVTGFTVENFYA